MRIFILGLIVALSFAVPIRAQEAKAPSGAIQSVIQSQIDAFLRDDFAQAFEYAGPSIQNMFRTPENFGAMVRNGYPMVWRPEDLRFGALREINGALWQSIILRDSAGQTHVLDYQMGRYPDGWRIDGVQLQAAPDVSA